MRKLGKYIFVTLAIIVTTQCGAPAHAQEGSARSIGELRNEIENKNEELQAIEAEIEKYKSALQEVGAEKATLNKAIEALELERKKLQADIRYTENKIASTNLTIENLTNEIKDTESRIQEGEEAVAAILRRIHINNDETLLERMLARGSLSGFWRELEALETVRDTMITRVERLASLQQTLQTQRATQSARRDQLQKLKTEYNGQQAVLASNQAEKTKLLENTRSEEAEYQKLLEEKRAARERLQEEVQAIESELQFILDPNSIPEKGTTVFNWPLASFQITQTFGYTKFALQNPGVYKGSMHNGIDLAAPTGTTIYAPLTGTVRAIGNTDTVPGCYSWGKWVLLDHPNGLSTLYAHLSHISVSPNQKLQTGDIIGHVGNTGYSTGPHLHLTLYASDAVTVKRFNEFKAVTGCGSAFSPFAAVEGYLDPLDYLPAR